MPTGSARWTIQLKEADNSPAMNRKYYSIRKGTRSLELQDLKALFGAVFNQFLEKGYFTEAFGYDCVDAGSIPGSAGANPEVYFLLKLRKSGIWPIAERLGSYSEDDLFDVIELLFDLVSKPVKGRMHSYSGCGMHWDEFESGPARAEFRTELNDILGDYRNGYELSKTGEVVEKGDKGLDKLLEADLPRSTNDDVRHTLEEAITLFRNRRSNSTDRRNAVRMLADVFESLRPRLRHVVTRGDEGDLFNIANNFAIRHKNDKQRTKYDESLWLSWMFYFYLATLHLAVRKLDKLEPALERNPEAI